MVEQSRSDVTQAVSPRQGSDDEEEEGAEEACEDDDADEVTVATGHGGGVYMGLGEQAG